MKKVALINGPFPHHLDHLAPLCDFLGCPLLVDDPDVYKLAVKYYPGVDIRKETIDLIKLSKEYELLILSTKHARKEIEMIYRALGIHHMRFCFCPHGQSDKGLTNPDMLSMRGQDIVLLYGDRQKEILAEGQEGHIIGNYRLAYYEKHKDFYDRLVQEEILQGMPSQKTILYSPTWADTEHSTTFFDSWKALIEELPKDYNLIIKLHPLLEKHHPAHAHHALSYDKSEPRLRVILEFPLIYPLLNATDIYLGDYSAIGYDFLRFDRPMIFLGSARTPLHCCGLTASSIKELPPLLEDPQTSLSPIRRRLYNYAFSPPPAKAPI